MNDALLMQNNYQMIVNLFTNKTERFYSKLKSSFIREKIKDDTIYSRRYTYDVAFKSQK